jgi:hypothetical protein
MTQSGHPAMARSPEFTFTFLPLFCDEKMVIEFSEVSGIPADHIRRARAEYLREKNIHNGNDTIN